MILDYIIYSIKKFRYYYIVSLVLILSCILKIVPYALGEYLVHILAVVTFTLGIPLSSGLRIDQLSEKYPNYAREVFLLVSFLVSFLNITFIHTIKLVIFGLKKENEEKNDAKKESEEVRRKTKKPIQAKSREGQS